MKQVLSSIYNFLFSRLLVLTIAIMPFCVAIVMVVYDKFYPELFHFSEIGWFLGGMLFNILLMYITYRFFVKGKISEKYLLVFCFAVANALMLAVLMSFNTIPVSDYAVIYESACSMANGTYNIYDLPDWHYMARFNYQTGMAVLESLFIRVFGDTTVPLKIIALICLNFTIFLTFKVAAKYFGKSASYYAVALSSTFYPVFVSVGQLTNNIVVIPLILWVLLLMDKAGGIRRWLLVGFLIALISIFRPVGIIIIAVAIAVVVSQVIKNKGFRPILNLVAMFMMYGVVIFAFNSVMWNYSYLNSERGITTNALRYQKYIQGFYGNVFSQGKFEELGSLEKYNEYQRDLLFSHLRENPTGAAIFTTKKMLHYLGDYDNRVEMTYNHDLSVWRVSPVRQCVFFGWGQYAAIILFAVYGAILGYKRRMLNCYGSLQIYFVFIIYVYFLIEAYSAYRVEFYPALIAFAGLGSVLAGERLAVK